MAVYSSVIIGTGSSIPSRNVSNSDFLNHEFYDENRERHIYSEGENAGLAKSNEVIINEFKEVTCIGDRRHVDNEMASDLGYQASVKALESANVDPETLDYIIFAHNFGDIDSRYMRTDIVPTLATRVKQKLGIKNRKADVHDLPYGCPGWVQGVIHTHKFFKGGFGRRALVIGAETLSKVSDKHDRDSMIYSDGGGAAVLEFRETEQPLGILSFDYDGGDATELTKDKSKLACQVMGMGTTYGPEDSGELSFKMKKGKDVFAYAVKHMPGVIDNSLRKAGVNLTDVSKILIHQANEKLDDSVVKKLFKLNGLDGTDERIREIMPMIISWLGNSSVATVPTLLDLILRGEVNNHRIKPLDYIVMASIGAGGPNINSIVYRVAGTERQGMMD